MVRLGIPDLISPSYFPAIAAIDLGFFQKEGLEVELEVIYPVDRAYRALKDDDLDLVCGSAHAVPAAFLDWEGAQILAALSQGMYWSLVMHSKFGNNLHGLSVVQGKRIGAAPMVELGLKGLLQTEGIDPDREGVQIVPVPLRPGGTLSFGVNAARALEAGTIDGFWANGMGARVAALGGYGTIAIDVRRNGSQAAKDLTFPALVTSEAVIAKNPGLAEAAVRAITKCQHALQGKPDLSTRVGEKRFPSFEASLIADLIELDAPYLSATISRHSFDSMQQFASKHIKSEKFAIYETVVPPSFQRLWDL